MFERSIRTYVVWCSSVLFDNIPHFQRHFVVRSTRKTTHFISFSFLTLNITTVNITSRIQILNSRFVLEHRYTTLGDIVKATEIWYVVCVCVRASRISQSSLSSLSTENTRITNSIMTKTGTIRILSTQSSEMRRRREW